MNQVNCLAVYFKGNNKDYVITRIDRELVESWEYFELLADKRLDTFLSELKLISNLQNEKIIWIRSVFYFKSNNKSNVIRDWLILVILHLTIKTKHLTYLSRTFTISKRKTEELSNLKNFHRFRGFALHCESAKSAENWQDFLWILGSRLDYFLSELKLISNLQNQQKIESWQPFDWKITTGVAGLIEIALFLLHCGSDIEN